MSRFYVYLLVDAGADESDEEIFYVGKGTGARPLNHFQEAQAVLKSDGAAHGEEITLVADQELSGVIPAEKLSRIDAILAAGRQVRVDILRDDLSSSEAFLVESAVIDAMGRHRLTNVVSGHRSFRLPATVVDSIEKADEVELKDEAVVVGVAGAWGGAKRLGGLLDAAEATVWENARHSWRVAGNWRHLLATRAAAGEPAFLIALGIQDPLWGGLVLGVWEIAGVTPDEYRDEGVVRWQFRQGKADSMRLRQTRSGYLGKRLAGVRAQAGVRYSDALHRAAELHRDPATP